MKLGFVGLFVTCFIMVACSQGAGFVGKLMHGKQQPGPAYVVKPTPTARPPTPEVAAKPKPTATPYKKMTFTVDSETEAGELSEDEVERLRELLEDKGYGDSPYSEKPRHRRGSGRSSRESQTY